MLASLYGDRGNGGMLSGEGQKARVWWISVAFAWKWERCVAEQSAASRTGTAVRERLASLQRLAHVQRTAGPTCTVLGPETGARRLHGMSYRLHAERTVPARDG